MRRPCCRIGQPGHPPAPIPVGRKSCRAAGPRARARKNDVVDFFSRNPGIFQQRLNGFGNEFEKPFVPNPSVFDRVIETITACAVMVHEVATDGAVRECACQQCITAADQHCRGAMTDLHLQRTGRARFPTIAGNHQ